MQDGSPIYQDLSKAEISLMVISILIHDIGMLSQDPTDLEGDSGKGMNDIATWVRKTHCARIPRLARRLLEPKYPSFVNKEIS